MESQVGNNISSSNPSNVLGSEVIDSGTTLLQGRIQSLTTVTAVVASAFENERKILIRKIILWSSISSILIFALFLFYYLRAFAKNIPDTWGWQDVYFAAIRITFISLSVSLIVFCLKILRAYMNLHENFKQKLTLVKALPTLSNASNDDEINKAAYSKILETIIKMENIGLIGKDEEVIPTNIIVDLLKEYLSSKK